MSKDHSTLQISQLFDQVGFYGATIIPLPNNKIVDLSKLKAFADHKINMTQKVNLVSLREENMGKGENAGNQHFLLFSQCFPKDSFSGGVKSGDCVVKG